MTLFFITDMFLFIRDCCFGPKSHGRCFCPIRDDFSDFTVLAEATGESVQDVTLFFFFFFHTVNYQYYFVKEEQLCWHNLKTCYFALSQIFFK